MRDIGARVKPENVMTTTGAQARPHCQDVFEPGDIVLRVLQAFSADTRIRLCVDLLKTACC